MVNGTQEDLDAVAFQQKVASHFAPQHDRIVVMLEPEITKTKAGLLLPKIDEELELTNLRPGRVMAVGQGRWDARGSTRGPMDLKVGDRVMFHKHAGEKIYAWETVFQIMGDGDVGLKIQEDTPVELVFAKRK